MEIVYQNGYAHSNENGSGDVNNSTILTMDSINTSNRVPSGPFYCIADLRGADALNYRKGEKYLRCKLATCCRLIDCYGWSTGIQPYASARVDSQQKQFLLTAEGLHFDEVTAGRLLRLNYVGGVVDAGLTDMQPPHEGATIHPIVYSARSDINCILQIDHPDVVALSVLNCGLLPLCREAMLLHDKVKVIDFSFDLNDTNEIKNLEKAVKDNIKVVLMRGCGAMIVGEDVEDAFYNLHCLMTAAEIQLNLLPFGLDELIEASSEVIENVELSNGHLGDANIVSNAHLMFNSLVKQLEKAGCATGCNLPEVSFKKAVRSRSTTDINPLTLSISNEDKKAALIRSMTPNPYGRTDSAGPASNSQRATKWVVESGSLSKPRSASVRVNHLIKIAPQGGNPKELKEKVKEIRREYFEDTITSGPQSSVLEGVTWEEARKIKTAGPDSLSAASRGIIQRDHQREALFYKSYTLVNPFERVTDRELEQYKEEVERKNRPMTPAAAPPISPLPPASPPIASMAPIKKPSSPPPLTPPAKLNLSEQPALNQPPSPKTPEMVAQTMQVGVDKFVDTPPQMSNTFPMRSQSSRNMTLPKPEIVKEEKKKKSWSFRQKKRTPAVEKENIESSDLEATSAMKEKKKKGFFGKKK